MQIPFFSVTNKAWHLALKAFAGEDKSYRTKQKWKSFFVALFNPKFASDWFDILESPYFIQVATHRPRLYFKPFRVYMSIRWNKKQKIKTILDTYRFIISKGEAFLQVITSTEGIEIARFKLNDNIEGTLTIGYDERYRKEGELVLFFNSDQLGGMIATAAFSFEELEVGRWVCRIGCLQGHKRNVDNSSKIAQKMLHGLRPKSLIVFTIQEFTRQLGFTAIYGAGDAIQAYRRKHTIHLPGRHTIQFDYDAIWRESGGKLVSDGWYEIPLTPIRKNIQEIKSNKRSFYLRRYCLLDDLSLKISDTVKKIVA